MKNILFDKFMELLEYSKSENFDQKIFSSMIRNFDSLYKRADVEQQGHYHELVSERLKYD